MAAYMGASVLLDVIMVFCNTIICMKFITIPYTLLKKYSKTVIFLYKLTWPAPDRALT